MERQGSASSKLLSSSSLTTQGDAPSRAYAPTALPVRGTAATAPSGAAPGGELERVLRALDVPAHHRRLQPRLLRWLYYQYHNKPDNGARLPSGELREWARDLGIVEDGNGRHREAAAGANAGIGETPMVLSDQRLLQLCKTVLCAERARVRKDKAGGSRPNPSLTLMHAVAQSEARVFNPAVQLFPHDLQWIVSASAAAPEQFTPSMTALQAELEAFKTKCPRLEKAQTEISHRTGKTSHEIRNGSEEANHKIDTNAMLQTAARVSMKLAENARTASSLLEKFSTQYAPQIYSWTMHSSTSDVLPSVGPLSNKIARSLSKIIDVLGGIKNARQSFDAFASLDSKLEQLEHLSDGRFDPTSARNLSSARKAIFSFNEQLENSHPEMPREKSP